MRPKKTLAYRVLLLMILHVYENLKNILDLSRTNLRVIKY
jgi:hypothetical protein